MRRFDSVVGLSINEGTIEILRRVVFSTVCLLVATGCASIVDRRRETVSFSSDPPGAQVIINGKTMGVTPAALALAITASSSGIEAGTAVMPTLAARSLL